MNKTEIKLYCFANSWWDSLSKQQQEKYLKQHPKSKRKVTALDKIKKTSKEETGPWLSSDSFFLPKNDMSVEAKAKKSKLRQLTHETDSYLFDEMEPLDRFQFNAVIGYVGTEFTNINKYLRGEDTGRSPEYMQEKVDILNSVIDKQRGISHDALLFRGVSLPKGTSYKEGETYENPSFLSTSASPIIACDFITDADANHTILQLKVKKGHKLLYIPNVAKLPPARNTTIPVFEREAVLKPKTKFKVLKVEKTEKGTIVHAEVI